MQAEEIDRRELPMQIEEIDGQELPIQIKKMGCKGVKN